MELANRVICKVIKNAPLHQASPDTKQHLPQGCFSSGTFFLTEINIMDVSEKNAICMAKSMILFSPILFSYLTTIFLSRLPPPLPLARRLAPSVWHGILRIYTFRRAVTTGCNLTRHPWEREVSFVCF